jgi:hypothetical protein
MGSFSQSSFHSPPCRDDAAVPMPARPHEAESTLLNTFLAAGTDGTNPTA